MPYSITFNPKKKPHPTNAREYFDGVTLLPGINLINDKSYEKLQENEVYQTYLENDVVKEDKANIDIPDSPGRKASGTRRNTKAKVEKENS